MISILRKLPWHMTAHITIRQRYRIYKTTVDMIQILQNTIFNSDHQRRPFFLAPGAVANDYVRIAELLNEKLLRRLVHAAMGCAGFSPLMKDNIAYISGLDERQLRQYGVPAQADRWRHFYALNPNPGVPGDVIDVCLPAFCPPHLFLPCTYLPSLFLSHLTPLFNPLLTVLRSPSR